MDNVGKRLGLLAAVVLAAVLVGSYSGPGVSPPAEARMISPGGIAVLPSALPGLPGAPPVADAVAQPLPAFAPASGPGSLAIAVAFCDIFGFLPAECPADPDGNRAITFTLHKLFPPGEPVRASFADIVADATTGFGQPVATGETTRVCVDDASCDLTDGPFENQRNQSAQHVAVAITGGGANEVLEVEACDGEGDCRRAQLFFVETILALLPLGESANISPHVVTYACPPSARGLYTGLAATDIDGNGLPDLTQPPYQTSSAQVTWEEVYLWMFGSEPWAVGSTRGWLRNPKSALPLADIPFYSCGGNTAGTTDDRVNFETDRGLFSIEGLADGAGTLAELTPGTWVKPLGTLSNDCDVGDSVDVIDHPGPVLNTRGPGALPLPAVPGTYCDLDFAPNGVVTYTLQGTGDVGVASVTGQQSGGGGVLRTINVSFTGAAAVSLFLEAPEVIGLEGGEFSMAVVDGSLRPLGGITVSCSAEPKDAVLVIIPQTGTTGGIDTENPGQVLFTLFPTRSAVETGVEVTLTCVVDSNPDVQASGTVQIGTAAETVDLLAGCNFETWTGDEIEPADLAELIEPAENLGALWAQQPSPDWKGFDAEFPEVSDMGPVNQLDIVAICMTGMGTLSRPML